MTVFDKWSACTLWSHWILLDAGLMPDCLKPGFQVWSCFSRGRRERLAQIRLPYRAKKIRKSLAAALAQMSNEMRIHDKLPYNLKIMFVKCHWGLCCSSWVWVFFVYQDTSEWFIMLKTWTLITANKCFVQPSSFLKVCLFSVGINHYLDLFDHLVNW